MKTVTTLKDIDLNIIEGKLLFAAICGVDVIGYLKGRGPEKIIAEFNDLNGRLIQDCIWNQFIPRTGNRITTSREISTEIPEGRLLIAAISYLSQYLPINTEERIIADINRIADGIFDKKPIV